MPNAARNPKNHFAAFLSAAFAFSRRLLFRFPSLASPKIWTAILV